MRREQRPRHTLRDPRLEVDRHREEALKLPERHLLPRLGRHCLQQHLRRVARVEVREEADRAGFAPPRHLLAEIEEAAYGGEGVLIRAGFGGVVGSKHVLDEPRMPNLLVAHVSNERAVLCVDPSGIKLLVRELGETVVEEVEFYKFLIKCEVLRDS